MKKLHKIFLASLSSLFILSSCEYEDKFDAVEPDFTISETQQATHTNEQLKKAFMTSGYLLTNNSHNSTYQNMFSVYSIPKEEDTYIRGVVVSTDVDGNTYKKLVIRDEKDSTGLDISIDASGLSAIWPQGQKVIVKTSGLHIGDYANFPAIGYQTYNSKRDRYEVGRLPYNIASKHIKAIGKPDTLSVMPEVATIPQILNNKEKYYSRLVKIENVRFGYYKTSNANATPSNFLTAFINMIDDTEEEIVFAAENDLNVPVSRVLMDEDGNTISLTSSFYAKFAGKFLPQGNYDITVIVAWYKDKDSNSGNMQLLLQKYSDIVKFEKKPEAEDAQQ